MSTSKPPEDDASEIMLFSEELDKYSIEMPKI